MSACSMTDCAKPVHGRGWCKPHYMRWWWNGDPEIVRNSSKGAAFSDRLDRLVDRTGECWLWLGAKNSDGYGSVSINGQMVCAHRAAYEELIGPIPENMEVDHLCYVRYCVNPDHLEAVTASENQLRAWARRRAMAETKDTP